MGKTHGLLGVERLIRARRIEVRIAEPVVDRSKSRASRVAGESHLHRGGLPRKDGETVAGHVQGQIHEDVDPVVADELRNFGFGSACDIAPDVGCLLESPGEGIRLGDGRIAEHFESRVVVPRKNGQDVSADDVVAEIRRDIADPQAALRSAIIAVRLDEPTPWLCVLLVPLVEFLAERFWIGAGMKEETVGEIAMGSGIVGFQRDGLTISGDGFFQMPLVLEGAAEIVERLGKVGFEIDRSTIGRDGFFQTA